MTRRSLFVTLAASLSALACIQAADDRVLFDFESGSFERWSSEGGSSFGAAPVNPDRDMQAQHDAKARYRFAGWVGDFMVSQDISLSKRRGIRETEVPGGRLISNAFTIDRDYIKFRLGGLLHPGVYVALVLEESGRPQKEGEAWKLTRQSYANNKFDLVERGWSVREFLGKQARIHLVVDAANRVIFRADHFVLSDEPVRDDVLYERTHWLDTVVMAPGKFHLMFPAVREAPAFANSTVVRGHDGRWHVFAEEFKNNNGYFGHCNNLVYHASADDLRGKWTHLDPVLARDVSGGESWVRFPTVAFDATQGLYAMLYWGSGKAPTEGPFGVHLVTSKDGVTWQRDARNPIFTEDFAPLLGSVVRVDGRWVLVYSNTGDEDVKIDRATLLYRTSENLRDWSERREFEVSSIHGQELGHSRPVLFQRGDEWFLFSNNKVSQQGRARFIFTQVYSSRTPFAWNVDKDYRGNLNIFHGPQVVVDGSEWNIVHWHPTSGGPWISRLRFDDSASRALFPVAWPGIPVASGR
jgi:hypothetical protein